MRRKHLFVGAGTALVTPFIPGGSIDWGALEKHVEMQIAGHVEFLVPCGTTGESPTLDHAEHNAVIRRVVQIVAKRIPVLAGTGSNSTAEAVALTRSAEESEADGVLVVMPYYNKPTTAGILDYYRQVAKVGLPVVLYDIPGRCGGKMIPASLILELAREGTIVGLKWASGDWDQLQEVLAGRPNGFTVLSGDDNRTFPAMCLGAEGVISVLANLMPLEVVKLVAAVHVHHHDEARRMHYKLLPAMQAMFLETNPIPVKTASAMVYPNIFQEVFRSPMVPMFGDNRCKLHEVLVSYDLLPPSHQAPTKTRRKGPEAHKKALT